MKDNKNISISPKNINSKRYSLSKSIKQPTIKQYLHATLRPSSFKTKNSSISTYFNPQAFSHDIPYHKLYPQNKQTIQVEKRHKNKMKRNKPKLNTTITSKQQIEMILKQDIKLRVYQSVQLEQWMELLKQYKFNRPEKQNQVNIVLREFQKIIQMKQELQIKKYRMISNMI